MFIQSNSFFSYVCKKIIKMNNRTFTMIKPDAVENGHIGAILKKINTAGFKIVAMKLTKLSKEKAEKFYEVHNERPFFGELGRKQWLLATQDEGGGSREDGLPNSRWTILLCSHAVWIEGGEC